MGHDTHFLSRLARVAEGQVDLAMGLYRDPELVREVLKGAAIPDGVERVAISLADPVTGPFVVVARDGHFVTCLGEGMRVEDLPLVSRAKLDAAASRLATLRERLELARAVTEDGKTPEMLPVWEKLVARTEWFSREDFAGLAAWLPVLRPMMYRDVLESAPLTMTVCRRLSRERGNPGKRREAAQAHGRLMLARSVMAQLLLSEPAALAALDDRGEDVVGNVAHALLLACITDMHLVPTACVLNGVAVGGKAYLGALKRSSVLAEYKPLCLVALAMAHEKPRAEIVKVLQRLEHGDFFAAEVERRAERHDAMLATARARAWDDLVESAPDLAASYGGAQKIPPHVATAVMVQVSGTLVAQAQWDYAWSEVPLVATAAPEDLWLPHDVLEALGPFDPEELAEDHFTAMRPLFASQPVVAEKQPGRNDPCSCGSGRKYKKCCGA